MQKNDLNRLDPISILREELIAAGIAHGAERCEELADSVVDRYTSRLGGFPVYVRNMKNSLATRLADEIYEKFDGKNTYFLAREYGKSVRTIQRIIMKRRPKN